MCTFAYSNGIENESVICSGRMKRGLVPGRHSSSKNMSWMHPVFEGQGIEQICAETTKKVKNDIINRFHALSALMHHVDASL